MSRWTPDSPGRLRAAALDLFEERGYEGTTVAEIAARAGVTERTFFRHFADKREVLFHGSELLTEAMSTAAAAAPADAPPFAALTAALLAGGSLFDPAFARRRAAVITANPSLQERELVKLGRLAETLAAVLRARDVDEPAASLAAHTALGVFHVTFARWVTDPDGRTWAEHLEVALAELRELTPADG